MYVGFSEKITALAFYPRLNFNYRNSTEGKRRENEIFVKRLIDDQIEVSVQVSLSRVIIEIPI